MEQETIQDDEVVEHITTTNINENLNSNEELNSNDELTQHNEDVMIAENDDDMTNKRNRDEESQDEWTEVVRRKQRLKALREAIQLTVTSKTIFPKQFALAKLFKAKNILNISKVKYINPFKITIEVDNEESADRLINCDHFIEMGWRFQRPFEVGLSYGVIKDIELDITEEDIIKSISCNTDVINVKRLQRKNKDDIGWSDCEKIRVGFKGSSLPTYIYIFDMKVRVEPYVFPVTQCSNCWRYGHTRKMCPSVKSYCPKCGGKHDSCDITVYKCINCHENHMALDRTCPVYMKERRIRDIMAEFNCSYRKAMDIYVPPSSPARYDESTLQNPTSISDNVTLTSNAQPTTSYAQIASKNLPNTIASQVVEENLTVQGPSVKKKTRKNRLKSSYVEETFTENNSDLDMQYSDQTSDEDIIQESNKKQKSDFSFNKLKLKIKNIILRKGESIKVKIQNLVQICVEWIITWIFHNTPDWSFLLRIFDDKNK